MKGAFSLNNLLVGSVRPSETNASSVIKQRGREKKGPRDIAPLPAPQFYLGVQKLTRSSLNGVSERDF